VAVKIKSITSDVSYTNTKAELSDFVFGGDKNPNNNMKSQYAECSYGKLTINHPPNTEYLNDQGLVDGVIEIGVNIAAAEGNDVEIRNAVTKELTERFGAFNDPNGNNTVFADHWMYCMPPGAMAGIAYAFINSWMSVYDNQW
jgi:hypothetical protein